MTRKEEPLPSKRLRELARLLGVVEEEQSTNQAQRNNERENIYELHEEKNGTNKKTKLPKLYEKKGMKYIAQKADKILGWTSTTTTIKEQI